MKLRITTTLLVLTVLTLFYAHAEETVKEYPVELAIITENTSVELLENGSSREAFGSTVKRISVKRGEVYRITDSSHLTDILVGFGNGSDWLVWNFEQVRSGEGTATFYSVAAGDKNLQWVFRIPRRFIQTVTLNPAEYAKAFNLRKAYLLAKYDSVTAPTNTNAFSQPATVAPSRNLMQQQHEDDLRSSARHEVEQLELRQTYSRQPLSPTEKAFYKNSIGNAVRQSGDSGLESRFRTALEAKPHR